jgi:T4 RnlA family RNA ligase
LLEISSFIKENPDWEEKLAKSPYHIKVKRDDGFVLLKYDQIHSDFSLPLVRECRGIILDELDNNRPVCIPFFKFGNFGESYVPEIDWSTARVQEKVDGSIIKLWHCRGTWHVSSNSEIDARNAHINSALLSGAPRTSLYTLFMEAWHKTGVNIESLDKNYTYIFELTSPHNRIVMKYEDVAIRHIGTRHNCALQECELDIGVAKPKTFPFNGLDECIESAKQMGDDDEGYVVVDQDYNRLKIKSPRYVALNHLVQGVTTLGNIVEIIQKNEQEEFLAYFPEYRGAFSKIVDGIEEFSIRQADALERILSESYDSRKELAEAVIKEECPACLFVLIDGKEANVKDWLLSRPPAKILALIRIAEI